MKKIWHAAREQEIATDKIAERIITQMIFSENLFQEEEIFADYCAGTAYFRLKRAYLAYISREYLLRDRLVKECIFDIVAAENAKTPESSRQGAIPAEAIRKKTGRS